MLSVVVTEVYGDYILVVEISDINHIKNVFRKVKGDQLWNVKNFLKKFQIRNLGITKLELWDSWFFI